MNSYEKNRKNAIALSKLNIGDRVSVIATGDTGVVTKKIKYDRKTQKISTCAVDLYIMQHINPRYPVLAGMKTASAH